MSITVLVAEDFEPFRQTLVAILQDMAEVRSICEVADGGQAVEKAAELQPELILLDIGLPTLNGIEAARQIRGLSPHSRIVFVSQEVSADIVQHAMEMGASGYVAKSDAGGELRTAIESVLRGERFLSNGTRSSATAKPPNPDSFGKGRNVEIRRHEVHFYSDDASFLNTVAHFLGSAIRAGDAAVVAVTKSHRDILLRRFEADGLDIRAALEKGCYISLDPGDLLSTFMVSGMPDPDRFKKVVGGLITTAAKALEGDHNCVALCGECAALLWSQGNAKAAIRLEQLSNEILRLGRAHLLCSYPLQQFQDGVGSYVFGNICAEHSAVYSR